MVFDGNLPASIKGWKKAFPKWVSAQIRRDRILAQVLELGLLEQSMDREDILKSMLSGVDPLPNEAQTKSIMSAMRAFSVKQLENMEKAGVRIWPFVKGLPPEYQITSFSDLGAPAEYTFQFRMIRISPTSLDKGA